MMHTSLIIHKSVMCRRHVKEVNTCLKHCLQPNTNVYMYITGIGYVYAWPSLYKKYVINVYI